MYNENQSKSKYIKTEYSEQACNPKVEITAVIIQKQNIKK